MTMQIYTLFSNPPNNRLDFCCFLTKSTLLGYMSSFFSKLLRLVFRIFVAEIEAQRSWHNVLRNIQII